MEPYSCGGITFLEEVKTPIAAKKLEKKPWNFGIDNKKIY